MRSDGSAMPKHIGALVDASSKLEHALGVARQIVQSPTCVDPIAVPAWPPQGFSDAARYTAHRRLVVLAESQGASRLHMLAFTLTTLTDGLCRVADADQATRVTRAIKMLGDLLVAKWGIQYDDIPPRSGPGFVPLRQWADRRALMPAALPFNQRNQRFDAVADEPKRREYSAPPRWSA